MAKLTAEQIWNEIRDDEAHGISRYDEENSRGGFTYEQAKDLGFIPPSETPEGAEQTLELIPDEPDTKEELGASALSDVLPSSGAPVERFVRREARIKRAKRKKAGKELSQTPEAKRARERRDQQNVRTARNIQENQDAWGR